MAKKNSKLKVGDWVTYPFGAITVTAQIVEDRGHIGYRGRRLLRVHPLGAENDETDIDVPEVFLTRTAPPVTTNANHR
jgi:hypothetical protein